LVVPGCQEALDGVVQSSYALELSAAIGPAFEQGEPRLHLVQTAGVGGSEVGVKAEMLAQRQLDLKMLLEGSVAHRVQSHFPAATSQLWEAR
jgi:hypothetical protein